MAEFTLVKRGGLTGDVLGVMRGLEGVVFPQKGGYWLAVGLEAKVMKVLEVSAVVLEFSPYASLGIFGRATAQMPPAPAVREACFLYVEMGIVASVDFEAGEVKVEMELSPNSFVLAPGCRLTGGFGLGYWYGNSPYAGDFVFTVGGYHPAFRPPAHWLVPKRLGISWALSDALSVRGEAYFAVTPKVCMGGGKYQINFDAGEWFVYLGRGNDADERQDSSTLGTRLRPTS